MVARLLAPLFEKVRVERLFSIIILLLSITFFFKTFFWDNVKQMGADILLVISSLALLCTQFPRFKVVTVLLASFIVIVAQGLYFTSAFFPLITYPERNYFTVISILLCLLGSRKKYWRLLFYMLALFFFIFSFMSLMNDVFDVDTKFFLVQWIHVRFQTALILFLIAFAFIAEASKDSFVFSIFFKQDTTHIFSREVLVFVFTCLTILAILTHKGQTLGLYDNGFEDILNLTMTLGILLILFWINQIRREREVKRREEIELKLNHSEALFQQFTENTDECFWKATPTFDRFIYVSSQFFKIWGREPQELIQTPALWENSMVPEDREKFRNLLNVMITTSGEVMKFRARIVRENGVIRYVKHRIYFVHVDPEFSYLLGISRDVTAQYMIKQRLMIQREIAKKITAGTPPKILIVETLKLICRTLDWDYGDFFLVNSDTQFMLREASFENQVLSFELREVLQKKSRITKHQGFPGKVWAKGRFLIKIPRKKVLTVFHEHIKIMMGFPIVYRGKCLGVMIFLSQHLKVADTVSGDILEMLGEHLGEYFTQYEKETEMHDIQNKDTLTNLMNRYAIEGYLERYLHEKISFQAVLVLSIDRFYLLNQAVGYAGGNIILKTVAKLLFERFGALHPLARLESDRFVIVPIGLTNVNQVVNFTMEIFSLMKEVCFVQDKEIVLSVSIGISTYPKHGKTAEALLKNAELAMLESRKQGGNQFQFFTESLSLALSQQLALETGLRHALVNNEFLMYYQPKIDLETGKIVGVESLIRWQHPKLGLLEPDHFMPVAEITGLVVPITEWIIREVFNLVADKKVKTKVAINISAYHFRGQYDLCGYLKQMLQGFHISSSEIELEITETALLNETQYVLSELAKLRGLGFSLTLDDFGTQYSSLAYLKSISAETIKVDKQFIDHVVDNEKDALILKGMLAFFHTLGKKVVAEGVENEAQLEILMAAHCEEVQGYYFSEPLSLAALNTLIQSNKLFKLPRRHC